MRRDRSKRRARLLLWTLIPAALMLVAAANAHLVYVALVSQPDCVPHSKEPGEAGEFVAARSAC